MRTRIARKQSNEAGGGEVTGPQRVICSDGMTDSVDAEDFQQPLWDMFTRVFPCRLTLPQSDRVRGHLLPELRITHAPGQFLQPGRDHLGGLPGQFPPGNAFSPVGHRSAARASGQGLQPGPRALREQCQPGWRPRCSWCARWPPAVDVVVRYTQTFLWLQRYDEGLLTAPAGSPGGVLPTLDEARAAIARLKTDLMARGEASELFGRERGDAFAALLGNLDQTVFGEPAYPTVETKAAHLLYFVIKNHPFADGNKRSGAFLFVDFLARNGRLLRNGEPVINDVGLAALALLVAESDAKNKDVMIRLIENMLALPGGREEG